MWIVEYYTGTHWEIDAMYDSKEEAIAAKAFNEMLYNDRKWRITKVEVIE